MKTEVSSSSCCVFGEPDLSFLCDEEIIIKKKKCCNKYKKKGKTNCRRCPKI